MKFTKPIIRLGGLASTVLISVMLIPACSSHIPPEIKQNLEAAPSVAQVRDNTDAYLSQKVRWGGVVLHTENKQNASWLTIVALPLTDNGKPMDSDQSPGRFIAIVDEFLEPLVYVANRKITVTGKVLRTETRKVGEFPYEYPVIKVDHHYLWPVELEPADDDYPPYWWYDPWYGPWYGPWYHPYYPHYPRYR